VADTPEDHAERGQGLLARISNEMVRAQKQFFGKGPTEAKSYMLDDLLLIVMRGGMTTAEKTMLEVGRPDAVREFRQIFENEMKETLVGLIEGLVGREVVTYQSQVLFDPDIVIEIFFFAEPFDESAIAQTVRTLTEG
jgi:uncharacterized protein YbcI